MTRVAEPVPGVRPNEVSSTGKTLVGSASASAARTALGLATVASSGAYSDLSGKPSLATVATTGAYSDLSGKPTLGAAATSNSYDDLDDKPTIPGVQPYYIEAALSGPGDSVSTGTNKAIIRVHTAGTITGLVIDCYPGDEPSVEAIEVDLNKLDRSTGTATTVLSAVASIATSGNTGSGTIDGTQAVSAGDLLSFDVDQGSDGGMLIATVEITPS